MKHVEASPLPIGFIKQPKQRIKNTFLSRLAKIPGSKSTDEKTVGNKKKRVVLGDITNKTKQVKAKKRVQFESTVYEASNKENELVVRNTKGDTRARSLSNDSSNVLEMVLKDSKGALIMIPETNQDEFPLSVSSSEDVLFTDVVIQPVETLAVYRDEPTVSQHMPEVTPDLLDVTLSEEDTPCKALKLTESIDDLTLGIAEFSLMGSPSIEKTHQYIRKSDAMVLTTQWCELQE